MRAPFVLPEFAFIIEARPSTVAKRLSMRNEAFRCPRASTTIRFQMGEKSRYNRHGPRSLIWKRDQERATCEE
jgi:hypothetical protein